MRNRINNFLRREGRQPVRNAQPLESAAESHSPEPLPVEYTITREEQEILWRTLERIPETYREPIVLFYREHQSVERVAAGLGLSEEAVHQRLSRGRKLLQEQVQAFVEGALERTNPGRPFTINVMTALPLLATAAKGSAISATAAKGGAAGLGTFLQWLLKVILPIGVFVSLGGWLGYKMGGDAAQSSRQQEAVTRFWVILAASLAIFVIVPLLLVLPLMALFGSKENFLAAMKIGLEVLYGIVVAALALWLWQRHTSALRRTAEVGARAGIKKFFIWLLALSMIAAASLFALGLSDTNWKIDRISTGEAQRIIAQNNQASQFFVMRFHYHSALKTSDRHYDQLWIRLQNNGRLSKFIAPADDATLSLLAKKGIECPIYVQGRDFEILGWQGKLLIGLFLFILTAGAAVFLTFCIKNKSSTPVITTGTKIGIIAAIILAALIVAPLAWLNHRNADTVHPDHAVPHSLTPERSNPAKQAARDFFEAMGKGDWDAVDRLCPPGYPLSAKFSNQTKTMLTGLELVSLGDPFTKPGLPQVWVPDEIRFQNGEAKRYNLAVRQDNPEQKWYFDGGF